MNFAETFNDGLPYDGFLAKYGNDEQRRRWNAVHEHVTLSDEQFRSWGWRVRDSEGASSYRSAAGSYRGTAGSIQGGAEQSNGSIRTMRSCPSCSSAR